MEPQSNHVCDKCGTPWINLGELDTRGSVLWKFGCECYPVDPLLHLLRDVTDSLDKDIDPALIVRGVALIRQVSASRDFAVPTKLLMASFQWEPERILLLLERLQPAVGALYNWNGYPGQWHPKAIEYIRLLQAALKEKKENG